MKANAVSFDTNLVVRMLVRRDNPTQSKIIAQIIENAQTIHLSDLAISETVWVLTNYYKLERRDVAKFFERLFDDPTFHCNVPLFQKAFSYYIAHPALSFEDCCLTADAELNNAAPLLTFDQKLATQLSGAKLAVTDL